MRPAKLKPSELLQRLNCSIYEACDAYQAQRSAVDGIPLTNVLASGPIVARGVAGECEGRTLRMQTAE